MKKKISWGEGETRQPISPQLYNAFVRDLGKDITERLYLRSEWMPFGSELEAYEKEDQKLKKQAKFEREQRRRKIAFLLLLAFITILFFLA